MFTPCKENAHKLELIKEAPEAYGLPERAGPWHLHWCGCWWWAGRGQDVVSRWALTLPFALPWAARAPFRTHHWES